MKVLGHKKESPFQEGPLIAKSADLGTFSEHGENSELLRKLNKRLKLFRGEDGWFARGRQGQLWEWGRGKLGFTVGTSRMIAMRLRPDLSRPSGETGRRIFPVVGRKKPLRG